MTYQQALSYLFQQLPMFQKVGGIALKPELYNISLLDERLDHPHQAYPTIHIAGTNGKGSTAHMIAAILQASGLKVGLLTSPHYMDFRERIKVNGQMVREDFVIDFVTQSKTWVKDIQPSFFELTVAMAFQYFKVEKVDVAVIETGLGGEKDSTNIITPILSIITNIGWDHQAYLGDTLPKIASQKAGIIKPDIPVVIGETQRETLPVFEQKALQENAIIYRADQVYKAEKLSFDGQFTYFEVFKNDKRWLDSLSMDLHGNYQKKNLQTALQALAVIQSTQLLKINIDQSNIIYGLGNILPLTKMQGRWTILQKNPLTITDSAHNLPGLEYVIEQLSSLPHNQLHIILGMVAGKDHKAMLALFPKAATYYFSQPTVPRKLAAEKLNQIAQEIGLAGEVYPSVKAALNMAIERAQPDDVIYIGGSTFVVAEVL